jgi:excisionase family DNA binding protein
MELLTPQEVIQILKIKKRTLYYYVQKGVLPYVRLQRNLRFRRQDIEEFIQSRLTRNAEVDEKVESIIASIKSKIEQID